MTSYVPSSELIARTVRLEADYTLARLRVLERLSGNPVGVAYRAFGASAIAMKARFLPVPSFNMVYGLDAGDEAELSDIVAWYDGPGAQPHIQLVPGRGEDVLAPTLAKLGFHQSQFHASMIAVPSSAPARLPDGVSIEIVDGPDRFATFVETYCAGRDIPDRDGFARNIEGWLTVPGWRLYIAAHDGKPGATAVLALAGGAANLADASTDPTMRNRGLHRALIDRRLADAFVAGAEFACAGAGFLSTSHKNMARAGMTLQFTRALWTKLETDA